MKHKLTNKSGLSYNGKYYNSHSFEKAVALNQMEEWEQEHFHFIEEWYNNKPYIEVQTSGSTGTPEKIRLAKKSMITSALNTAKYLGIKPKQKALLCLPSRYIGGKMMIVRAMVLGLELYAIKPSSVVKISMNFDLAALTPHQVKRTMIENRNDLNLLKYILIGGGSVDQQLKNELQKLNSQCYATYGMTETSSHIALQKLNGKDQSNYFELISDEIQIRTDNTHRLFIKSSYLGDEEIQTKDLVEIEDPRHFKWLGRLDNMINSGAIKLFPEQIEKKLEHLIPNRYFIFAEKHPVFQERPALLIEKRTNYDLNDLLKLMNAALSSVEMPFRIYETQKMTETENGKIKRKESRNKIIQVHPKKSSI